MLRMHTATSASAVKNYFKVSDYYAEGESQETVGRWGGELARRLGLEGRVTKDAFDKLCDNIHPATGQPLTPRTNGERRVGNDHVYSGPKSFGVVAMLGPQEVRDDLLALLADTAEQVQDIMQADMRVRVRKGGADTDRVTGNMLSATYLHTTSRPVGNQPPDPHPHVHAFTFNATFDPVEGRIKAGQFCDMIRDRPYYEALFFSKLADGLAARGYAIERRAGGKWELAGVPQSVIDKFSKRKEEVEDEAKRLGVTNAALKAGLGAKTRRPEAEEPDAGAAPHGVGRAAFARGARGAGAGVSQGNPARRAGDGGGIGRLRARSPVGEAVGVPAAGSQAGGDAARAGRR